MSGTRLLLASSRHPFAGPLPGAVSPCWSGFCLAMELLICIRYNDFMPQITNELMYEVLKAIQARVDGMDKILKDLAHGQIRIREDLNNFQRDTIRLDTRFTDVSNRLERIEIRLNLTDA
jgi:hypothetical protein